MTQNEEGMWEQIFSRENMRRALRRVEANQCVAGVDGMRVNELTDHLRKQWPSIRAQLDARAYEPSPVKRIVISKQDGTERVIGIPTVQDRLIQQAMYQILSEKFDPTFSDASYGFRLGRSAHDAVREAQGHIEGGKKWLVKIELERFFDTVHHDRLLARLAYDITDQRVLWLVNQYLESGVMANGVVMEAGEGRAHSGSYGRSQGGALAPLFSNIILDELDGELERRGHSFVRYVDECNIYMSSHQAAEQALQSIQAYIERKLRLKVNEERSTVELATRRKFLGFTFY